MYSYSNRPDKRSQTITSVSPKASSFTDNRHVQKEISTLISTIQRQKLKGKLGQQTYIIEDAGGHTRLNLDMFLKVTEAISASKILVTNTLDSLSDIHNPHQMLFEMTFGSTQKKSLAIVKSNFLKILSGLNQDNFEIKDYVPEADEINPPHGYVWSLLGFKISPIHINLKASTEEITFTLIHEASHLFANTTDIKYFRDNMTELIKVYLNTKKPIETPYRDLINKGHNNADSYSNFAYETNSRKKP